MIRKYICKGKREVDGCIVPDLPEHKFSWRICDYNILTNTFYVTEEIDDTEHEKIKEYEVGYDITKDIRKIKIKLGVI
jgi:hypothetical protein